jgi:hypothetical protein
MRILALSTLSIPQGETISTLELNITASEHKLEQVFNLNLRLPLHVTLSELSVS